jgi:short-subunit dehydrogenase
METNFFGMLRMAQAFAPVLAANGGGAMLNVLSIASWINRPLLGAYGSTKSAAWALTNGLRNELREQGTQVTALHMGFVDTDLTRGIDVPKSTPESIVRHALDGLEAGSAEVLADEATWQVKQSLSGSAPAYLAAS